MKRRTLLQAASLGAGAVLFGPTTEHLRGACEVPPCEVDVLVIGGGSAGSIAAIQAARAGARTMLVEMGSQLGGTTTTGGVAAPAGFHAGSKQVVAGIGWELFRAARQLDQGEWFTLAATDAQYKPPGNLLNPELYAALVEEACLAAGVELCYYEVPLSIEQTADGWKVETAGKGVRRWVACNQLIDCTGGADVVGMLGLPRLREEETQPGALIFLLGGYDPKTLDAALVERRYQEAMAKGQLQPGDYVRNDHFIHFLRANGANAQYVLGADSSTAATKTQANIAGRASLLRLLRFIRTLSGCEKTVVRKMMQETAVRETWRIVGEVQITRADYTGGRKFDDAIAYACYSIDIHRLGGGILERLPSGVLPTVPLRALIPKGSRNLLVAGRSVSSDRAANSGLRVQATCMAMGQAAGAAATIASQRKTTPGNIPLDELRALLRQHDAIIPG